MKTARDGNGTTTRKIRFVVDIVIEPDGADYYAYAPALKGVHMGGRTEKEATKNVIDAVQAYIESLLKHGDPIPLAITQTDAEVVTKRHHSGVHAHQHDVSLPLDQLQPA